MWDAELERARRTHIARRTTAATRTLQVRNRVAMALRAFLRSQPVAAKRRWMTNRPIDDDVLRRLVCLSPPRGLHSRQVHCYRLMVDCLAHASAMVCVLLIGVQFTVALAAVRGIAHRSSLRKLDRLEAMYCCTYRFFQCSSRVDESPSPHSCRAFFFSLSRAAALCTLWVQRFPSCWLRCRFAVLRLLLEYLGRVDCSGALPVPVQTDF